MEVRPYVPEPDDTGTDNSHGLMHKREVGGEDKGPRPEIIEIIEKIIHEHSEAWRRLADM